MAEDVKPGSYICSGCEIGDKIDIESLVKTATDSNKAAIVKTHPILCSGEGVDLIRKDIAENELNAISVCACSSRVMTEAFSFDNNIMVDRANIREFVAWTQKGEDEDRQMLAEDYLRMGMVRALKAEIPEPHVEETDKSILVVGGGASGMT